MSVVKDIETLVRPVLEESSVELVDVEYRREAGGWTLRFFLDKDGGVGLADCEEWSRRLGQLLDEGDVLKHPYSLEISSPGLNRPLKKIQDFLRFKGIDAVIKLFSPQSGQKNFHGRIAGIEGEDVLLDDRTAGPVKIPLSAIASARLDPKIEP